MSCKVTVQSTDHQFTVDPGESVLDAALRHGIGLPYGCRNGFCGACKGKVVSGKVSYEEVPGGLSEQEQAAGHAFFCKARPEGDLTIEVEELTAEEIKPERFNGKVVKLERLADDVMRLGLALSESDRLQFRAGQYIDLIMNDGRKRAFSLANAPHCDEMLELHVRHVEGGEFTGYVFDGMQVGEEIAFEGPLGTFHLREDSDRPILLVGGGTGFAPLKGIVEHAFAEGVDNAMTLYWGAREEKDLYLDELPRSWAAINVHFHYVPVLSRAGEEQGWHGRSGWVHEAVVADHPDLSGFDVYMSGPPAMIDAAKKLFLAHGLPEERIFSDAFEFAADAKAA
ncbi:CDP-6-deoxy-delta-3,4-glucoseen reductase [Endothiovibrio diazotrophicus]